ncbi:MAG: hypothetical protein PWQ10_128 [Patescibacteria group bacterium]|nr:hypothetical protein [Patescibacteria group bacterium]
MNIKETIIKSLKQLVTDRYLLILLSFLLLFSIVSAVIIGFSVHPSELQLVSRYSEFGISHLYRNQWFYLLTFILFEIIVSILHIVISIKLLIIKNHFSATVFAWLGIVVIFLGLSTSMAVLNVWTPL